jgi:hypothetical protein
MPVGKVYPAQRRAAMIRELSKTASYRDKARAASVKMQRESLFGLNGKKMQQIYLVEGAVTLIYPNTKSYTVASGNLIRVEAIDNFLALFNTANTEKDAEPIMLEAKHDLIFKCTQQFIAYPFIAFVANGGSVANTNSAGYDVLSAIKSSLSSYEHKIEILGEITPIFNEATDSTYKYSAKYTVDMKPTLAKFFKHLSNIEVTGDSQRECFHGIAIRAAAGAVVYQEGWKKYTITQQRRKSFMM